MRQKMCFGIILINLAARMKNLIFSTIFAINSRNSLFMQGETIIGNNFGRIEDRAVNEVCVQQRVSAMVYQMV